MNLFTAISSLKRSSKGRLTLQPYMLDAPHTALSALTLALAAAVIERPGLVSLSVAAAGAVLTVSAVAVLPDGTPVKVSASSVDAAGLSNGTPCALVLSGSAVTESHTITVDREPLTHLEQIGAGLAVIVPGLLGTPPAIPAGSLLLARFAVTGGAVSGLVIEQPTLTLLGTAATLARMAALYSPVNRVPLGDGYGPDLTVPDNMPWAERNGGNPCGWFMDLTPTSDALLNGLDDLHQPYAAGQAWTGYIWDAATSQLLGKAAATMAAPRVTAHFAQPVVMKAGRTYRIGWAGSRSNGYITVNYNGAVPVYPGFLLTGTGFDNYSNRYAADGDPMPPVSNSGSIYGSFSLLLASDFKAAGVTGRLQPGALPVSAALRPLADGEGYIYTPAGQAPEWRYKSGGIEYRAPFAAAP